MTKKFRVAAGVVFLVLGVAVMAVIAQEGEEAAGVRTAEEQEHFVAETLGPSATATDVWSVQCGAGTGRVNADVNDNGGIDGIRLNVTVVNPQGRAISRTAPENGISLDAILFGGPGNYLVIINKTAGSLFAEPYDSVIDCQTALGVNTPHNVVLVQDQ
jgi:hypothetical protein